MLRIIKGDIFDAKEKYLVHQCNCQSKKSSGIAREVFTKYPYSNIYENRNIPDKVGSICIKGNGIDRRYVINLFGQNYPGKPSFSPFSLDSFNSREEHFKKGLFEISKLNYLESICFPWKIGCGAAGGNWETYLEILINFADYVNKLQQVDIIIYKKD